MTEQAGDILALNPAASNAFNRDSSRCLDGLITREGEHPLACGGHADIWKGQLGGRGVAVKVMRPWSSNGKRLKQAKLLKSLWREYLTWSSLSHPNVIELLGFSYDFSPDWFVFPSLISPWMSNGTVDSYIEENTSVDCLKLLIGIGEGLSYLHSREPLIVHGDLRAGNVLVSDSGDPCLSDFGLSRIPNETKQTPNSGPVGSLRWMAPELFHDDNGISVHSDVWAFGMTILELLTGKLPYSATKNDAFVLGKLTDGVIPGRPGAHEHVRPGFNDDIWEICRQCWNLEPTRRPSMRRSYKLSFFSLTPPPQLDMVRSPNISITTNFAELLSPEETLDLEDTFPITGNPLTLMDPLMRRPHGTFDGSLAELIDLLGIPPVEASARTLIHMYYSLDDTTTFKDECKQLHKRLVELLLDIQRIQISNDGRYVEFAKWAESIIEKFSANLRTCFKGGESTIIDGELRTVNEEVSRCSDNFHSSHITIPPPALPVPHNRVLPPSLIELQTNISPPAPPVPHNYIPPPAPLVPSNNRRSLEHPAPLPRALHSSPFIQTSPFLQMHHLSPLEEPHRPAISLLGLSGISSSIGYDSDPTENFHSGTQQDSIPQHASPLFRRQARRATPPYSPRKRKALVTSTVGDAACLDGRVKPLDSIYRSLGRSTNILQGHLGNQKVAIKIIRSTPSPGTRTQQQVVFERFWIKYTRSSSLSHPNILPHLGFTYEFFANSLMFPSLVSPWMANGTLPSYLEENPSVNRHELVLGVARGLCYLHSRRPPVVHGDLRAENILVSETGIPCLNPLHLSEIFECGGLRISQNVAIESLRWMSPELLREDTKADKRSDVWAYAMMILEIITGKFPYDEVRGPVAVLRHIRSGNIPSRPATFLNNHLWELCTDCWEFDAVRRKSMPQVIGDLSIM